MARDGAHVLEAAKLAAAGVLIGLPAAVLAMQMLREAVYPTSPTDAGVYMIVAITTVLVAILAAYVPAWRAGRVDPIIAMKAS